MNDACLLITCRVSEGDGYRFEKSTYNPYKKGEITPVTAPIYNANL